MRVRPLATRFGTLALTLLIPGALAAQGTPIRVPDEPSCAACKIISRDVVSLTQPAEHYARPMRYAIDPKKRVWLIRESAPPLVFDSTGKFLQILGKKGSGPDEYEWVDNVIFAGDTTVAFDRSRFAVLGPSLKAARYVAKREQLLSPVVVSWPTRVLASPNEFARDTNPAIKVVSLARDQAEYTNHLGPRVAADPRTMARCAGFFLTSVVANAFWAVAPRCGYDLIEFRTDGTQLRSLERRPTWFDRTTYAMGFGGPSRAPETSIAGLSRGADGLIWVFLYRPLATWKEGWARVPAGAREVSGSMIDYDKILGLRIEVIDPAAGRVVARQDFDGFPREVLSGMRVAYLTTTLDGDERIIIREFRLTGR